MRRTLFSLSHENDPADAIQSGDQPDIPVENDKPEKPLNVDLVYRKNELEENDDKGSVEYKAIDDLLKKRQAEQEANEPETNEDIPGIDASSDDTGNDDLEDDESTSEIDTDDTDDDDTVAQGTQNTQSSTESLHLESYYLIPISYTAESGGWTSDGEEIFNHKISSLGKAVGSGAGSVAGAAASGVGKVASGAGSAIKGVAGAAYDGGKYLAPKVVDGVKYLAPKGYDLGKKLTVKLLDKLQRTSLSLVKFSEHHQYNLKHLEKQIYTAKRDVSIKNREKKQGYYDKPKVLERIFANDNNDLKSLLAKQIKFYKTFGELTLMKSKNQSIAIANFVHILSNSSDEIDNITMKQVIEQIPTTIFKTTSKEYIEEGAKTQEYESKEILLGNKVLVGIYPNPHIDTLEEYFKAMKQSKTIIYTKDWTSTPKIEYMDQKELLEILNFAEILVKEMRNTNTIIKQVIGFKEQTKSSLRRLASLERLENFLKLSPKTKKIIAQYTETKASYTDTCYIEPYLSLNNMYCNSLKYVLKFVYANIK
jgi:hypothetical protein